MGCICSRRIQVIEGDETARDANVSKSSQRISETETAINDDTVRPKSRKHDNAAITPAPPSADNGEMMVRKATGQQRQASVDVRAKHTEPNSRVVDNEDELRLQIADVPNGFSTEHVVAGWPNWLTSVAGEVVNGWLPRRANSFEKLDKIGQGTYSSVYRARDLETGKIVALKKVRFVNLDPESVRFMAREIHVLRRLDHPNVVKLEGIVTSRMSCSLYLVFEYMEHDLAGLAATPSIKFTEPQVKCYMKQLLSGLEHCHSRGVLHRDIKGSNLLLDNNGNLRIADFGLATLFNPDQGQPLTSRVVTLWYRPPELLLGATDYGVAVDLWSTGCILAELLAGKPIMAGRTEVEQLHKIFKLCGSPAEDYWEKSKLPHATIFKPQHPYRRCVHETFKEFPPSAVTLLNSLLAIEPTDRGTAASALKSDFFTTKPLACDPSSLPKYPPSKEFDAKLRNAEEKRQRAEAKKNGAGESKAMPTDDELQKRQVQPNPKSSSVKYNAEDGGPGFPIEPPRESTNHGSSYKFGYSVNHKGRKNHQMVPGRSTTLTRPNDPVIETHRSCMPHEGPDLLNFAAVEGNTKSDNFRERINHPHWPEHRPSNRYNQLDVADASHHVLDRPSSSHKKDDRIQGKESSMGYGAKKNRIHYSGPLMTAGGNIDDMLREHERQIQQAVRKARLDKANTKKNIG